MPAHVSTGRQECGYHRINPVAARPDEARLKSIHLPLDGQQVDQVGVAFLVPDPGKPQRLASGARGRCLALQRGIDRSGAIICAFNFADTLAQRLCIEAQGLIGLGARAVRAGLEAA